MAYDAFIPQGTDFLSQSQPEILSNFTALDTAFSVNHVALNLTDQGKHKWVAFNQQLSDPAAVSNDYVVYSKIDSASSTLQLFGRIPTGTILQLTGPVTATDNGSTVINGGIYLKWGNFTAAGTTATFSFPSAFPTNAFNVQLQQGTGPVSQTNSQITAISQTGFTYDNLKSGVLYYYCAIGN